MSSLVLQNCPVLSTLGVYSKESTWLVYILLTWWNGYRVERVSNHVSWVYEQTVTYLPLMKLDMSRSRSFSNGDATSAQSHAVGINTTRPVRNIIHLKFITAVSRPGQIDSREIDR